MSRKLARADWQVYFDRMSRVMDAKQAELEVESLGLGDQIASEWVALDGITYDSKDDLVEMILEDLDHLIRHPQEIWVEEEGLALANLEVVDREGVRHILRLRDPLMLPPPEGGTQRTAKQPPRPAK
jgi:hypothetical protein